MVRCADCGFLATHNAKTENLDPVDHETRKTGRFPGVNIGSSIGFIVVSGPCCFQIAADLGEECKTVGGENPCFAVITKDRACLEFTKWHPGFTPKEHREMLFDLERKKLEIQERESERQWQERCEQKQRRFQLLNTLISAVVGAICTAIIGGIVAGWWAEKSNSSSTQPIQTKKTPVQPNSPATSAP